MQATVGTVDFILHNQFRFRVVDMEHFTVLRDEQECAPGHGNARRGFARPRGQAGDGVTVQEHRRSVCSGFPSDRIAFGVKRCLPRCAELTGCIGNTCADRDDFLCGERRMGGSPAIGESLLDIGGVRHCRYGKKEENDYTRKGKKHARRRSGRPRSSRVVLPGIRERLKGRHGNPSGGKPLKNRNLYMVERRNVEEFE